MHKKSAIEMQRSHVKKASKTLIRLKHSLAADEEINGKLPDMLSELEAAFAAGELRGLRAELADVLTVDTGGTSD